MSVTPLGLRSCIPSRAAAAAAFADHNEQVLAAAGTLVLAAAADMGLVAGGCSAAKL